MSKKITTEDFINRVNVIHGDRYDYSKVEYTNAKMKVCIICKTHGEFWQTPCGHSGGQGCPKCANIKNRNKQKSTTEDFIKKAKLVHGDKYDYSKTIYVRSIEKVKIICPVHGEFEQTAAGHLCSGCIKCSYDERNLKNRYTQEEIIEKFKSIHGDKYNYDKVIFGGVKQNVIINCPLHGDFEQTPDAHINKKSGCPKCAGVYILRNDEFIELSKNKFLSKFSYDKTVYLSKMKKVVLSCEKHGYFSILPVVHLRSKHGCPKCANVGIGKNKVLNNNEFIRRAIEKHGNEYDYSKTNYACSKNKVIIICHKKNVFGDEHGEFIQLPFNHIKGHKCPKCGGRGRTTAEAIMEMENKFGDLFDFSKFNYLGSNKKSTIICKKHGEFESTYTNMMESKHGCAICSKEVNYYEIRLLEFIRDSFPNNEILVNYRPDWLKKEDSGKNQELDIFIPALNIAVEYQGRHHFVDLYKTNRLERIKELDLTKYNKCNDLGVKLYYFTEDGRDVPDNYIDKIYTNKYELLDEIKRGL